MYRFIPSLCWVTTTQGRLRAVKQVAVSKLDTVDRGECANVRREFRQNQANGLTRRFLTRIGQKPNCTRGLASKSDVSAVRWQRMTAKVTKNRPFLFIVIWDRFLSPDMMAGLRFL
jgi:hypothetical protein